MLGLLDSDLTLAPARPDNRCIIFLNLLASQAIFAGHDISFRFAAYRPELIEASEHPQSLLLEFLSRGQISSTLFPTAEATTQRSLCDVILPSIVLYMAVRSTPTVRANLAQLTPLRAPSAFIFLGRGIFFCAVLIIMMIVYIQMNIFVKRKLSNEY